jgi:hypothetical protein
MPDPVEILPCENPDESQVRLPTICRIDIDPAGDPHEPPIGFGDGSLYISWNLQLAEGTQGSAGNPRPYQYILADQTKPRGDVAVVRILTEKNNGRAGFTRYILPRTTEARVLIWLQQLTWNSPGFPAAYEGPSAEAQILVKGNYLSIETDRSLQASLATYKNNRRFGYEHPGYDRHFRIAKWEIRDLNNNIVNENNDPSLRKFRSEDDDEAHYIYISFHD